MGFWVISTIRRNKFNVFARKNEVESFYYLYRVFIWQRKTNRRKEKIILKSAIWLQIFFPIILKDWKYILYRHEHFHSLLPQRRPCLMLYQVVTIVTLYFFWPWSLYKNIHSRTKFSSPLFFTLVVYIKYQSDSTLNWNSYGIFLMQSIIA